MDQGSGDALQASLSTPHCRQLDMCDRHHCCIAASRTCVTCYWHLLLSFRRTASEESESRAAPIEVLSVESIISGESNGGPSKTRLSLYKLYHALANQMAETGISVVSAVRASHVFRLHHSTKAPSCPVLSLSKTNPVGAMCADVS